MEQITPPVGFYVYQLIDPRDGLPFYVGKGQGWRAWHHQRAVQAGKPGSNARKVAKIKEILSRGDDVQIEIVAVYDLELDALDHEYRLIDSRPTLTNIMEGGGMGRRWTPEELQRRAEIHRKRMLEKRQRAREAARERDRARLAAVVGRMRQAPGADLHAKQIDEWATGLTEQKAPKKGRNRRKTHRKPGYQGLFSGPRQSSKASKRALAEFRASKPI